MVKRISVCGRTLFFCIVIACVGSTAASDMPTADAIYRTTGVKGGLVVQIGCGDGQLTAALHVNDRFLVQGLDVNAANVAAARTRIQAAGVYGPVTAEPFDGRHLPYADRVVNLIVSTGPESVPSDEIQRVLAPGGVAYIRDQGRWSKKTKPWPTDVDQWSHFLHDASGNAVANDMEVGPPTRLRWVAGPRWCRSHEFPSSVNAVVTAGGRIFTIFDEGPTGVYRHLPQQCQLVARGAANGVLLWKVPMRDWQPEFGTGTGNRWNIHHTIPRRLIAAGDRVYVTLRFLDSPVSVLDAATGQILTDALEGTGGTDEMILSDGILIVKITHGLSVAATARFGKESLNDTLAAVDVRTGRPLWRHENIRVVPYALSAVAGKVVYHNTEHLVCLDIKTGAELWQAPNLIRSSLGGQSTLVLSDNVVLFHGHGELISDTVHPDKKSKKGFYLSAYSLRDGHPLWVRAGRTGQAGACTQPTDLFAINGTVWCGGSVDGYDLQTGAVRQTVNLKELISPGHHYRCHRSKATSRYLIWPKRGAEFVDLEAGDHMRDDWLRAPCFTGATPANGLFYAPSDQCFCYPGVKVSGYLALAAGRPEPIEPSSDAKLERGAAYGQLPDSADVSDQDWPIYRHDNQRSGATGMSMPANLQARWTVQLGGQATQPVIAGDRLWVAEKDAHCVRCLDVTTGRERWRFTAGGRIDSTPTYHRGTLVFGCRDGTVYCVRAADGVLAWRFQAAPSATQVVSFGQLESLWPVSGSVLVQNGVVYFAAGRSSFLDGGILVYALDARTGHVLQDHLLQGPWPDISKDVGTPFAMEGALPDLMVSDGKDLYMQRIKFDPQLKRLPTIQESSLGELDMGADHLVATGGFLDDTGFDRLYWTHGRRWPGFYFSQQAPKSGQLVVFDATTAYAVKYFYRRIQWSPAFFPGEKGYLLFADDLDNEPQLEDKQQTVKAIQWLPKETLTDEHRRGGRGVEKGTGYVRTRPAKWQEMIPLRVRAMVLAKDQLFVVGLPDRVDPNDPLAAIEGRRGAMLQVFSTQDGQLLNSIQLASAPAFDGLSAARGRLFLTTLDGKLICFSGE